MSRLYASPIRVYLILGALALGGILSGLKLPISLFPNSAKPVVHVSLAYASHTSDEFLNTYGKEFESELRAIATDRVEVESIEAEYLPETVHYRLHFKWGGDPNTALREVQSVGNAYFARLPREIRETVNYNINAENQGFFAVSFFSQSRDLDELYQLLEPVLTPKITKVPDAQNPSLWNPSRKEIRIDLNPETVAALQLFPRDIEDAVQNALSSRSGGAVASGAGPLQIQMPRQALGIEQLANISIPTTTGKSVHLSEIARIDYGPQTQGSAIIKTNGAPTIILFATPKPGGNVKKMSEDLSAIIRDVMPSLPKDIQYKTLVDPSEFIRSAVNNVLHEVLIAAMLAVVILFLFIGSFKNVMTAAIEIPLSMVLAFILMRLFGMNLNLISLGGLALAAGMNVDASVVVMENIFRHFEMNPGQHDFSSRLKIVSTAVGEVTFPIIASTLASLVVFLPLTFTSELSYAILGDLAKAVVFSHGLSAIVALILVPTVRLHLMSTKGATHQHPRAPIEKWLSRCEGAYAKALQAFIDRPKIKWLTYTGLAALLAALCLGVLPHLPREIVGVPDTDWMILGVSTDGNSHLKQMEASAGEVEKRLLSEFSKNIQYTFTQIRSPNNAFIMARLKDKDKMRQVWKAMEASFTNTPLLQFFVAPWNPSELPIPDPPDMRIAIRGADALQRTWVAQEVFDLLQSEKVFPRLTTKPSIRREKTVLLSPNADQWSVLREGQTRATPHDLLELLRVATHGKRIGFLTVQNHQTDIVLRYPEKAVDSLDAIKAFPIAMGNKLVPLKALAEIAVRQAAPLLYRQDEQEVVLVTGRESMAEATEKKANLAKAKEIVANWEKKRPHSTSQKSVPTVNFEEAAKDLNEAISQLTLAVVLSVALIFLTMLIQFGTVAEPLLVLTSVPLGFIGVLLSLWVFQSTLSLNSILGVILLNGIAVANSIILVDFIKRLVDGGASPKEAAIEGAKKRLRPILITSLTTVLGMLPIAVGLGEGGRILQPLGIAVSGGLWVSMLLTLFLVPTMQVSYLEWKSSQLLKEREGFQRVSGSLSTKSLLTTLRLKSRRFAFWGNPWESEQ